MNNLAAQQTYVPDDNFELYLELNGMGNGVMNDDSVATSSIDTVTYLDVSMQSISDLKGIEAFISLIKLSCGLNPQLSSLDLSQNTMLEELECQNTDLTTLDVSQNINLKRIFIPGNFGINSIDLTQNTSLTYLFVAQTSLNSIDLSHNLLLDSLTISWSSLSSIELDQNIELKYLNCSNNPITSLNVSQNMGLVYLDCSGSLLECLNVKNGNNYNFDHFDASSNPALNCIEVDDDSWSTSNWTNVDTQSSFNVSCNNGCTNSTGTDELKQGQKKVIKTIDFMGREITPSSNEILIYIFADGSVEKVFATE